MRDLETLDIEIKLLLEGIYLRYKSDFRNYTFASVRRRVCLAMAKLGCHTVSQLQDLVLGEPAVFDELLQFLTVPTSEMFRDPSYFKVIREQVVPVLMTYPSVKIWIAGCSTGEELYSMAILLKEENLLERSVIYATDINPISLKKAETGTFAIDQMRQYTVNYQKSGGKKAFSDYYQTAHNRAIFDSSLRANVAFADHSLATDSVFAEVQLVSCRNVMIYFNRELQNRAFKLFYESLDTRGFLGIGSKETIRFSDYRAKFDEIAPTERVYRKKVAV